MPVITAIVLAMFVWLVLVLSFEFWKLPKRRIEAYVSGKKVLAPKFDSVSTVSLYGDDEFAGARETPSEYVVTLLVNGSDVVMWLAPEMYCAAQVGTTVTLVCSFGRLSRFMYTDTIILPMPDMPTDSAMLS